MIENTLRKNEEIANFLHKKTLEGGIAAEVAQEALESEDYEGFFSDLSRFGCVCGMI